MSEFQEAAAPRGDQFLEGLDYQVLVPEPTPTRTAIIIELAIRLRDLHDFDTRLVRKLLNVLDRIYRNHPESFRLVLDVLAGNVLGEKSLSVIQSQKPDGLQYSKQNIHQTEQRRLEELARELPDIARILGEIRGRAEKP